MGIIFQKTLSLIFQKSNYNLILKKGTLIIIILF